jgi:PAS domain-containing protein
MALYDEHLRKIGVSVRPIRDFRSFNTKVQWQRVSGPSRISVNMGTDENAATAVDLGRVVNTLPAMVWTTHGDGRSDFVNRYWREYTGFGFDSLDHGWQRAIHPGGHWCWLGLHADESASLDGHVARNATLSAMTASITHEVSLPISGI